MLKACWDCISGFNANRNPEQNSNAYDIQLNGDTQRAPPWPNPQSDKEIMFLLPKTLSYDDMVTVSGQLRHDFQRFTISLITGNSSPDYQNIACQVEARIPPNYDDKILIRTIHNGIPEEVHADYLPASEVIRDSTFQISFSVRGGHSEEFIVVMNSGSLPEMVLQHKLSDIRYLSVEGDIENVSNLDFQFA